MARGRTRSVGQEVRSFVLSLLLALVVYWLFSSGIFMEAAMTLARWYAEQVLPVAPGR